MDWLTAAAKLAAEFRDLADGDRIRVRLDTPPARSKNRWGGDVVKVSVVRKRDDTVTNIALELSPAAFIRLAKVVQADESARGLSRPISVKEVIENGRRRYEFEAGG